MEKTSQKIKTLVLKGKEKGFLTYEELNNILPDDALVRPEKIDEILMPYENGGEIPDEVIDKILAIVDVEMDATKLAADVYQSGVEMADEFLGKIDDEAGKIADEIDDKLKKSQT